jgi:hypothetical protein
MRQLLRQGDSSISDRRGRQYGAAMRVYLAGASGVIGSRLVPLLLAAGHRVAA